MAILDDLSYRRIDDNRAGYDESDPSAAVVVPETGVFEALLGSFGDAVRCNDRRPPSGIGSHPFDQRANVGSADLAFDFDEELMPTDSKVKLGWRWPSWRDPSISLMSAATPSSLRARRQISRCNRGPRRAT